MENLIRHTLIDTLAKDLTVLVISNNEELKNSLHYFFDKLDSDIYYLFNKDDILEFYTNRKVDITFIDLNISQNNPFTIINEIKYKYPLQYTIGISKKDSKDILYKCIQSNLNDFLLNPFTNIQIKDSVIHCLEKRIYSNKITDPTIEAINNLTPEEVINSLLEKGEFEIELVGNYKGVPIIKKATLVDINNEDIKIKIDNIHKYILKYSKKIVLSSLHLSYDIYANLSKLDEENNIAIFHKLSFINSYIHHRKNIRIIPDNNFSLKLYSNGNNYHCKVRNISEDYSLIHLEKPTEELKINTNLEFDLAFKLENKTINNNNFYRIKNTCNICDIFIFEGYDRVLIHFELDPNDKKALKEYIYQRGKELIKEFKKICN